MKLGLIGYGAIGKHIEGAGLENIELTAVLVKRPRNEGKLTHDPDRFFAHTFDAVAECAGHEAVRAHGQRVLEGGADFLVTSVGAFTDTNLFDRLLAAAKANQRRLILPSAGIGALDILSSAAVGGLDQVTATFDCAEQRRPCQRAHGGKRNRIELDRQPNRRPRYFL